jgi:uncharacterized spore protein YtfJ
VDEQAEVRVPRDRPGEFMVRMAEAIGARADASTVFSQPISQDGTTVIPVARVRWGFGGGTGARKGERASVETGLGGGGGAIVSPVGYLVLRNGRVRYRRITSLPALLGTALAGFAVAVLLRR